MAAGGVAAKELTPVTLIYFTGSSESIQIGVMVEHKLFEKHGLKPEFANATSGPAITSALASGSVQFGPGYPGLYLPALKQKRDLVVAAPFAETSFYSIIGHADADIKDPGKGLTDQAKANLKQLEGKRVGVTALGAQTQIFVQLLAQQAGVDASKITFIPTGGAASALSAFKTNQVDYLVTWIPEDGLMKDAGIGYKNLVNVNTGPDNTFGDLINDLWLANGKFVRENPEAALAFCKATIEARQFIADPANKDAVLAVMQKYQALKPEGAQTVYNDRRYVYEPTEATYVDEDLWKAQSQYLTGTSLEGYVPPYKDHINAECMKLGKDAIVR
ncbi:ABC transporter substrate-binding protein [Pusillimonas sp. TS35]|nr:ABC transporter substrate-binding protein [Pusillimonas sp. TS35]